jgi:hypothetical protein
MGPPPTQEIFKIPPWKPISAENVVSMRSLLYRSGISSFHALEADTELQIDLGSRPVAGVALAVVDRGNDDDNGDDDDASDHHHRVDLAEFQAWASPSPCEEDLSSEGSRLTAFRASLQSEPVGAGLVDASLAILQPGNFSSMKKCTLRYKLRGVPRDQRRGLYISEFALVGWDSWMIAEPPAGSCFSHWLMQQDMLLLFLLLFLLVLSFHTCGEGDEYPYAPALGC